MSTKFAYEDKEIAKFHIPRWNELPTIDLYLDQLVSLLEQYFSSYIDNENEKNEKIITKTMINNYVKHKIINPPINKKYNKEHIAYIFVICILKQVYTINDIGELLRIAIKASSPEKAYDHFCDELEKALKLTFSGEEYPKTKLMTKEIYLLRNVVQSFATKLYVKRSFLKK